MFDSYIASKKEILYKLNTLNQKVISYEDTFLLDLTDIKIKIKKSIERLEQDKFSITLFGAFSDGKSSLIAGMLENPTIKIDVKPTTSEIEIYEFQNYTIVDTPGLFAGILNHSEKTRKYISESQVIIFTLDSVNPINNSQIPSIKWILEDLDVDFFFAKPYHSWQRGSNENLNGLIRQFIPKKTDFSLISDDFVQLIQDKINRRPRKRFGYQSPNEKLKHIFSQ